LGEYRKIEQPVEFLIDDGLIIPPAEDPEQTEVLRGPNIKPLPVNAPMDDSLTLKVLLKVGDNITTDHIMPAGSRVLPLRSNIPAISEFVFSAVDPEFSGRAKQAARGVITGGHNYGQGSSREHAALAPMYLGVKAVLAKSFARIHRANLINFGILPIIFAAEEDYEHIRLGDVFQIDNLHKQLKQGDTLKILNLATGKTFTASHQLTPRQAAIVLDGGLLNYTRNSARCLQWREAGYNYRTENDYCIEPTGGNVV
jgi:aconitate hydratase